MPWNECEKSFIRKVDLDPEKIRSIVGAANDRLEFIHSLPVNEKNVSFIFENYYEVIKELLIALLLKDKLRSSNHQCLFTYFSRKFPKYESELNIITQMSYLRNRLNYYGEKVEYNYFKQNHKDFELIIKLLLGLLK